MDLIILHVSNGRKNYEMMCFTILLLSFINDDECFISSICDLNNGLTNGPGLVSLVYYVDLANESIFGCIQARSKQIE